MCLDKILLLLVSLYYLSSTPKVADFAKAIFEASDRFTAYNRGRGYNYLW